MSNAELNSQSYKFVNTTINGKPLSPNMMITSKDVGAVPLDGTTPMNGSLRIRRGKWAGIVLENTETEADKRARFIELADDGTLNIITRSNGESSENKGLFAFSAGVTGNVITDAGFTMKGTINHHGVPVNQFRGNHGSNDLSLLPSTTVGVWSYTAGINAQSANIFPAANNANGCLTFNTHDGEYCMQIGFSSDGNVYKRGRSSGTWSSWVAIRFASDAISAEEVSFSNREGSNESLKEIILRQEEQISKLESRLNQIESSLQNTR